MNTEEITATRRTAKANEGDNKVVRKSRKMEYCMRIELHTGANSQQNQCLQKDPGLVSPPDLLLGGPLCLGCVRCLFRVVQVDASLLFSSFFQFYLFLDF